MAQDNHTELTEVNEKGKGIKNWDIDRIASRAIGMRIMKDDRSDK